MFFEKNAGCSPGLVGGSVVCVSVGIPNNFSTKKAVIVFHHESNLMFCKETDAGVEPPKNG